MPFETFIADLVVGLVTGAVFILYERVAWDQARCC